jgi:hypothetical protein
MNDNITMPLSPVVDARLMAHPEWRRYLGATRESIKLLQDLIEAGGGAEGLSERLSALMARINALTEQAANQHERLVAWQGTNDEAGTKVQFNHDLGTRNLFWFIRSPTSGVILTRYRELEQTESSVRLRDDDYDPIPAGMDATFIGVISDRY